MTRRTASWLLALAVVVPLALAPAGAQEGTFEGTADVVSIPVPVNVVDRDGQPIRGLTADQFEIVDEGDPQRIASFEVVDLTTVDTASVGVDTLGTAGRRHFLLLFDLSFASPTAVLKARLAAREFLLESLHPTDLAAVATYSIEQGARLVVTFTPDRAQLARGIDTLGVRTPDDLYAEKDPLRFMITPPLHEMTVLSGINNVGESQAVRAQTDQMVSDHMRAIAYAADRSEREYTQSRLAGYTSGLAELARMLHAVSGRKNVVYFSEGFESNVMFGNEPGSIEAESDTQNVNFGRFWMTDSDSRFGSTGLQNDLFRMLEEFRRADCVIQAIDIGGLRTKAVATSQRVGGTGQEMLFYLANETGGELYRNANDFREQLERVLQRSEVTYLLTFERSDLPSDGSYRRLRVRLKDAPSGARISHRPGYYAPRPFAELHPLEKDLLASDAITAAVPRDDIAVSALAAPFRANEELSYVPVILEVAGKGLLAANKGDDLQVEIYAYASDAQGQMRDFFAQRVRIPVAQARRILERTGLKYYGHLDLPPGDYRVRVLVRNAETGHAGVESVPLKVPTYAEAQPALLPPLFFEEQGGWLMVREKVEEASASVVYPFTLKGEPYIPSARPVLDGDPAELCLVGYNLGRELTVEGRVLGADGAPLPNGRLSLVERTATGIAGLDKLLARFEPDGLAAGDYVLEVAVRDTATGRREVNSLGFTID